VLFQDPSSEGLTVVTCDIMPTVGQEYLIARRRAERIRVGECSRQMQSMERVDLSAFRRLQHDG
jgi:hypothetical protein